MSFRFGIVLLAFKRIKPSHMDYFHFMYTVKSLAPVFLSLSLTHSLFLSHSDDVSLFTLLFLPLPLSLSIYLSLFHICTCTVFLPPHYTPPLFTLLMGRFNGLLCGVHRHTHMYNKNGFGKCDLLPADITHTLWTIIFCCCNRCMFSDVDCCHTEKKRLCVKNFVTMC